MVAQRPFGWPHVSNKTGDIQESGNIMDNNNSIKEEELVAKIQSLVAALRADSRPEELDRIKKLVKKNVPFTLRGYFSAYLLRSMMAAPQTAAKPRREREARPAREKSEIRKEREAREPHSQKESREKQPREANANAQNTEKRQQRVVPADAKTLYINLGKIGHVYAKDLVNLIVGSTGLSKDDIYLIRLHDKYSFISMSEENCEKAIAALQGTQYKGRTIQINISIKERRPQESARSPEEEAVSAEVRSEEAAAAVSEAPEAATDKSEDRNGERKEDNIEA